MKSDSEFASVLTVKRSNSCKRSISDVIAVCSACCRTIWLVSISSTPLTPLVELSLNASARITARVTVARMLIRLSILIRAKLLLLSQQVAKALATVSARPPLFCTMPSNVPNGKHATMRIVRRSSVTPTPTLILVVLCMPLSSPPFANPSNPRLSLFIVPNIFGYLPPLHLTPYTRRDEPLLVSSIPRLLDLILLAV